jgi:hypothetical protein
VGRKKIIRTAEEIAERKRRLAAKTAEWRRLNPEKAKALTRNQNAKAAIKRKELRKSMTESQIAEIKEKQNTHSAKYRSKNRGKCIETARKYRETNPEKSRQASRRWADSNRIRIAEYDRARNQKAETKEKRNSTRRDKHKADFMFVLECRCRSRTYYAFRAFGFRKTSKTAELLGADWATVRSHIESLFTDGMGWHNRHLWHIDHVEPIASASNQEHLHRLFHYTNLQPLWIEENMRKSNRTDYDRKPQFKKPLPQWVG